MSTQKSLLMGGMLINLEEMQKELDAVEKDLQLLAKEYYVDNPLIKEEINRVQDLEVGQVDYQI